MEVKVGEKLPLKEDISHCFPFLILVKGKPRIMFPTHDKLVLYENEEARLRCYADIPSTPRSRWITPNGTTLTYNESILIPNVSAQHAGLYTCEAENSYGTATRSVNVTVKSREYLFCDVTALFLSILLCLILINIQTRSCKSQLISSALESLTLLIILFRGFVLKTLLIWKRGSTLS